MTLARARLFGPLALLVAALACRGPRAERPVGACTHLQAVRQVRGTALCEDAWACVRPPAGPFDRVGLHRLARCEGASGPVVLYLPGMHMNSELPATEPQYDLRLYLAAGGVRTWGLDYRTHAVPAEASEADLEALGRWTTEVFLGDVGWATGFVRSSDPGPLYLAGFSHGAGLAYRFAGRSDEGLAGLLILDGAHAAGVAPKGGGVAIDVGGSRLPFAEREQLLAAVVANPAGPSPLPGFATAGDALAETLYTAPSFGGRGGLANTRDDVSDVRVLAELLRRYDRWWPRATLAAPPPTPPRRTLRVLAFASTNLGPTWVERVRTSARAFGGPEARVRELRGYGHLDVLVGRRAARDVYQPALTWLAGSPPT